MPLGFWSGEIGEDWRYHGRTGEQGCRLGAEPAGEEKVFVGLARGNADDRLDKTGIFKGCPLSSPWH
eukprot:scaffold8907_cov66-Skeletonema_dohrnii-CCMP3373.AAC.1